jgi:putative (di)nucleoside polyphosphate hydrolase
MPQGGIDEGENIWQAALRELKEEIGTDKAELIKIAEEKLKYDLPPELQKKLWRGRYRGQIQTWVAARFTGTDADIDIQSHKMPEFNRWKWVKLKDTVDLIVPFKRETYARVIKMFGDLSS